MGKYEELLGKVLELDYGQARPFLKGLLEKHVPGYSAIVLPVIDALKEKAVEVLEDKKDVSETKD